MDNFKEVCVTVPSYQKEIEVTTGTNEEDLCIFRFKFFDSKTMKERTAVVETGDGEVQIRTEKYGYVPTAGKEVYDNYLNFVFERVGEMDQQVKISVFWTPRIIVITIYAD